MGCGNPKSDNSVKSPVPFNDRAPPRMEETKSNHALAVKTDGETEQKKATESVVAVE